MSTKDFFWQIFQDTGLIGAYLVYKELSQNEKETLVSNAPSEQ